jgi:leucyl aminopeptidase
VRVEVVNKRLEEVEADLHVVARTSAESPVPEELASVAGAADTSTAYKKLTLLRPESGPERLLIAGLGDPGELDDERLRVLAALAVKEAGRFKARSIAWSLPVSAGAPPPERAAADLVAGTILASYRFDRFKSSEDEEPPPQVESLTIATNGEGSDGPARSAELSRIASEAANRARELQQLPSNIVTPSYLAERAEALASEHGALSVEVLGREQIAERGMGGLEAVSSGTPEEPKLIVLRHKGNATDGETLGLVGKGVTFDTGGISIKPSRSMAEMKMDMSGAAAVLEAMGAIAELELPLSVIAVIPSTENMPSGTAVKPGDVITQLNRKTVEVDDTDAEGRLILADALAHCVELGADRIVDLATLTGSVVIALGSTYAGLISNDDELASLVERSAERTGELAWRLPLHPEYKELTKGKDADLANISEKRKAGTIYAASFLEEFVDGRPWAHLDIAGTAWNVGREYVGKGPTGYGVRLLVDLAIELTGAGDAPSRR